MKIQATTMKEYVCQSNQLSKIMAGLQKNPHAHLLSNDELLNTILDAADSRDRNGEGCFTTILETLIYRRSRGRDIHHKKTC